MSQLERAHFSLVEAIVNMPWTTLDSATVKSYTVLIGMLLSARPEYLSLVLGKIAQGFTYRVFSLSYELLRLRLMMSAYLVPVLCRVRRPNIISGVSRKFCQSNHATCNLRPFTLSFEAYIFPHPNASCNSPASPGSPLSTQEAKPADPNDLYTEPFKGIILLPRTFRKYLGYHCG